MSTHGEMDRAAELRSALTAAGQGYDSSESALAQAQGEAESTLETFMSLGGSASLAEQVVALIEDLHRKLEQLQRDSEDAVLQLDTITTRGTPEENSGSLDVLISRLDDVGEAIAELIADVGAAASETQDLFRGSRAADRIDAVLLDVENELKDSLTHVRGGVEIAERMHKHFTDGGGAAGPSSSGRMTTPHLPPIRLVPSRSSTPGDPTHVDELLFEERSRRRKSALLRHLTEGAEDLAGAAKVTVDDAVAALGKPGTRSEPLGPPLVTGAGDHVPASGSTPPASVAPGDVVSSLIVVGVVAAKGAETVYVHATAGFAALMRRWRKDSAHDD